MSVRRSMSSMFVLALLTFGVPTQSLAQVISSEAARVPARIDRPSVSRPRVPSVERGSSEPFVRTELFFGTAKPGGVVTDQEFEQFLDEVVTPLFPDGLTVVRGDGQFRGADGITVKEDAYVLILLYPFDQRGAGSKSIEAIRTEYKRRHQQESVLRVDESFVAWVQF